MNINPITVNDLKKTSISSECLMDAIYNYIKKENFPKNLLIRKLRLLNEKNEGKIKELQQKSKEADKAVTLFEKQIQEYKQKNRIKLQKLREMERDF